jgi:glucose-1-phosphate adenylyltransferase
VGIRAQVASGSVIKDTVLNGSDFYAPDIRVGPNSHIEGAIIDKNARIGEGVVIRPFPPGPAMDGKGWLVRDGIVVLPKDAQIPDGTHIEPGN